jgi:large subunit ribosomal protein L5
MTLKEHYFKNVIPKMKKKFAYANDLAVPRLSKIIVNVGLGQALKDKGFKEVVEQNLKAITGQKPALTRAKHSIAGFGIREGLIVGAKVTLRGQRMYDFLGKVINIALPRVRDFSGLDPKSLDKGGNLTIGFKECVVFPEINPEDSTSVHGLELSIVTTAKTDKEAVELFKLLKFPLKT